MASDGASYECRGANFSITLTSHALHLKEVGLERKTHELPVNRVRAVIVRRKTIIPFAAFTLVAGISAVVLRYNAFWFLVDLSQTMAWESSVVALGVCVASLIPTMIRALFVSVTISWDGEPHEFLVNLVSSYRGRGLARRFQEVSVGAQT